MFAPVTDPLPLNPVLLQQPPENPPFHRRARMLSQYRGPPHASYNYNVSGASRGHPSLSRPINRANSQQSTGPRTPHGKQRSSLNALRHGLTAASAVLPTEDPAAYADHRRRFFDEYQPTTPTESQLVVEVADTSWRLNRIPLLEAEVFARAAFDIVDAHRLLANLGIQGQRLSRQFQKSLDKLREIQAARAETQRRNLKDAAALLELHKHRGIPWDPADHGFVLSKDAVERCADRLKLLNQARHIEYVLFHMPPREKSTPPFEAAQVLGTHGANR
jgi:hypothetical protein